MARSPRALAFATLLLSSAGALLAAELVVRLWLDPEQTTALALHVYPGMHDAELGYVPEPGARADHLWDLPVTIRADGVRSNGAAAPPGSPVLVVGDSFTFGDEVADQETWPAALERALGRPVLNGGVFGYGFDQIVLRAERLLATSGADTLVVSLTPDDVRRCEYAYRYAWKPWFSIAEDELVLNGVPVPSPEKSPAETPRGRQLLEHSALARLLIWRLDPEGSALPDTLRVHRQGVRVARLLVDRLAASARARGHALLLVVQWHPAARSDDARPVIERARELGVPVLLLEPLLRRQVASHAQGAESLFHLRRGPAGGTIVGHMTASGNEQVARAVARALAGL